MGAGADPRVRARALGSLYIAGGAIGAVSLVLPHAESANNGALWVNVFLATSAGLVAFFYGQRFPSWALHAGVAAGALLITRAVFVSHEPVSFYAVWYIWIGLYAFYFFERRAAALHVAFAMALFGLTLVNESATSSVARWLTTAATLVVAGVFIDTLVRRARAEARAAAETARSMAAVAQVSHELASLSDSAEARPALCRAAVRITGAEGVALWERGPDGKSLVVGACEGRMSGDRRHISLSSDGSTGVMQTFDSGMPTVAQGAALERLAPELDGPGLVVWQPVGRDGETGAVVEFWWSDSSPRSESLITLTSLLAAEVAVTLERVRLLARLESIARTDDLTGLPNRRAWQEELAKEVARAERDQLPLCVAILDLDRFKLYNDEHGHQAGDRFLKQAAAAWNEQLRATDVLARYGGEEFVLALPACAPAESLRVIERLRAATPDGQTCSAGMACWNGTESPGALIGRADAALYEAKRAGRDQTVSAGSAA